MKLFTKLTGVVAALSLSACAGYQNPTYNSKTGCVEYWDHVQTLAGVHYGEVENDTVYRKLGKRIYTTGGTTPRYGGQVDFKFQKVIAGCNNKEIKRLALGGDDD